MAQKFYTRLTQIGQAKYANAVGVGEPGLAFTTVIADGAPRVTLPAASVARSRTVCEPSTSSAVSTAIVPEPASAHGWLKV